MDDFVNQTMLTCLGNKRKLVENIFDIVKEVSVGLSKEKLNIFDGFSGSSVVSRKLSFLADNLYINDMEKYAFFMGKCFLQTPDSTTQERIRFHINKMNQLAEQGPFIEGIISNLYSPKNTKDIQEEERCFYTRENALIIDTLRKYIEDNVEPELEVYCLVPLLTKASIHTNTAGVFKGFYKKGTKGCFGGAGEFALSRIMKPIRIDMPIWNQESHFTTHCYNGDINDVITQLPDNFDVIYLDPPYNQHPYGSNYFMLNVIIENKEPQNISKVSGIPSNWNKSNYNKRINAIKSMKHLLENATKKTKYVLLSYNNEGIINMDDWKDIFKDYKVKKYEIDYNTYKGSRNLANRSKKVVEIMYLISR